MFKLFWLCWQNNKRLEKSIKLDFVTDLFGKCIFFKILWNFWKNIACLLGVNTKKHIFLINQTSWSNHTLKEFLLASDQLLVLNIPNFCEKHKNFIENFFYVPDVYLYSKSIFFPWYAQYLLSSPERISFWRYRNPEINYLLLNAAHFLVNYIKKKRKIFFLCLMCIYTQKA